MDAWFFLERKVLGEIRERIPGFQFDYGEERIDRFLREVGLSKKDALKFRKKDFAFNIDAPIPTTTSTKLLLSSLQVGGDSTSIIVVVF